MTKAAILTVQLDDGTCLKESYKGWSAITGHSVAAIQKRMSVRKLQIASNMHPYSMRQVCGLDELSENKAYKKHTNKVVTANDNLNWFNRRRLV